MRRTWILAAILWLAACTPASPSATQETAPPTPTDPPQPAATFTPTQPRAPLFTLTVTPTAALGEYPTLASAPGLVAVEHPRIMDFTFLVDPFQWELRPTTDEDSQEQLYFLRSKTMDGCELRAPHIGGIPTPVWLYSRLLGDHIFIVFEYSGMALYGTTSLITDDEQYFDLQGIDDPACLAALEVVLTDMMEAAVYHGARPPVSLVTPLPPPTPMGYQCNSLPPRLQVGDRAFVSADAVWLRSEPRRAEETQSQLITKHAPQVIYIESGPVCADDHTFWAVEVYEVGEGIGLVRQGWIAEANLEEYLLEELP